MNSVHATSFYFVKIHFSIIFPVDFLTKTLCISLLSPPSHVPYAKYLFLVHMIAPSLGYVLDGSELKSQQGQEIFFYPKRQYRFWGPPSLHLNRYLAFLGVERP